MAYNNLSTARNTELESRVTQLESSLTKAYSELDAAMSTGGVESFKFDSGDASQWAKYRSQEELLKTIDILWRQIDFINGKLNNTSNIYMALRRKQASYGGFS